MALFLFLLGWQVMVAAMMLPASLPAVHRLDGRVRSVAQSAGRPAFGPPLGFLLGYAALWTIYGVGAFGFDVGLHRLTDAVPWPAARPWLIESTAVLAAGAYQFAPMKRRALEACRHPFEGHTHEADGTAPALALGVRHGYDCVIASWALMLLMFSAGFANVWWMLALAVLMALETFGRPMAAIVRAIGLLLFVFAGLILFSGWIPAFAT